MYYPDEVIQEVIYKNDIVDVVSPYVDLKRSGSNMMGLCPFHSEKTPSFSVSPSKQMFYCFGCGVGGNVISFLMKYENLDFQEALKMLADRAGVTLPERQSSRKERERASRNQLLMDINKEAAVYYCKMLFSQRGKRGYDYFHNKRRLSDETIKRFGLGYSEVTDHSLAEYLKGKGYDDKAIIEAGLATFDEKNGMRDRFYNRVMFPIMNPSKRVIGFGGRVLGDGKPKYLNTSDTPIFDKRRNLYGLNYARSTRENSLILCEGYMDVISMHQAGFTQAVASLGTAFTEEQAEIVKRMKKGVLLAYDSDGAGISAALRAIGILRNCGIMPRVINMRPYKDPDEFIKNLGTDEFRKRMDEAENGFMYILRQEERDYDLNDPGGRTEFEKKMAWHLCTLEEGAERDNYTVAAAKQYAITVENLKKLMVQVALDGETVRRMRPVREDSRPVKKRQDPAIKQKQLLNWLAAEPSLYGQISSIIHPDDFDEGVIREAAERLFEEIKEGTLNIPALISAYEDEGSQSEIASIFSSGIDLPDDKGERRSAFLEILTLVKQNSYERKLEASGTDLNSIKKAIEEKQALEQLKKLKVDVG